MEIMSEKTLEKLLDYKQEQYEALEAVFDYIDENEGVTFSKVVRHFKECGNDSHNPILTVLTTDWGTMAILAYLGE